MFVDGSEYTDHAGDAPQASAWGDALRRAVRKFSRVQGPLSRGRLVAVATAKFPRVPRVPCVLRVFIRVSNARLIRQMQRGESGRRAQYLLDILGTTDRLPPPLPLKFMLVKYVLRERPVFVFDTCFVPAEYYISYGVGSSIYDFLNSHLQPTDIDSVRMESDGVNVYVAVVYRLSEKLLLKMPSIMPMEEDDCPF